MSVPSQIEWRARIKQMRAQGLFLTPQPAQQAVRPQPPIPQVAPQPTLEPVKLAPPVDLPPEPTHDQLKDPRIELKLAEEQAFVAEQAAAAQEELEQADEAAMSIRPQKKRRGI